MDSPTVRVVLQARVDPLFWLDNTEHTIAQRDRWKDICARLPLRRPELNDCDSKDDARGKKAAWTKEECYRQYRLCTLDERIVLAGLAWEGYFNPANKRTLLSLFRRGVVAPKHGGFEIVDDGFWDYVRDQMDRRALARIRLTYRQGGWRSIRLGLFIGAIGLILFAAYGAQHELRNALGLLSMVAASLVTITGAVNVLSSNGNADGES